MKKERKKNLMKEKNSRKRLSRCNERSKRKLNCSTFFEK